MRDAFGEIGNHLFLVIHHSVKVQAEAFEHHAVACQRLASVGVFPRGLQQRLGGNAANIEASTTERWILFHTGSF